MGLEALHAVFTHLNGTVRQFQQQWIFLTCGSAKKNCTQWFGEFVEVMFDLILLN